MLWFFVIYSVLGVVLTLVSAVVTLAALARIRRRIVALQAQSRGEAVAGWDRLIDRLVPEPVMIDTFPRMSLATELMELTGQRRAWLRGRDTQHRRGNPRGPNSPDMPPGPDPGVAKEIGHRWLRGCYLRHRRGDLTPAEAQTEFGSNRYG